MYQYSSLLAHFVIWHSREVIAVSWPMLIIDNYASNLAFEIKVNLGKDSFK
jgi:hypothetical protein